MGLETCLWSTQDPNRRLHYLSKTCTNKRLSPFYWLRSNEIMHLVASVCLSAQMLTHSSQAARGIKNLWWVKFTVPTETPNKHWRACSCIWPRPYDQDFDLSMSDLYDNVQYKNRADFFGGSVIITSFLEQSLLIIALFGQWLFDYSVPTVSNIYLSIRLEPYMFCGW